MINPLVALLLLGNLGNKSGNAPRWPNPKHPPPNRLPDPATPRRSTAQEGKPLAWDKSAHPMAARGTHKHGPRAANTSHAPRASNPHVEIGPAEILHKDAAPPMPPASVPPPPDAPPAPQGVGRTPQQAARELYSYARAAIAKKQGSLLGTKGRPNPFVRDAQSDMGLKPDGIYGPATRARGNALLGRKDFPARVAGDQPLYIP